MGVGDGSCVGSLVNVGVGVSSGAVVISAISWADAPEWGRTGFLSSVGVVIGASVAVNDGDGVSVAVGNNVSVLVGVELGIGVAVHVVVSVG